MPLIVTVRSVAVSARSVEHRASAASLGEIAMRSATVVRAGTYVYEGNDLTTGWHHHDLHQIEYAFRGVAEVETDGWRYLLPPRQAIWIPAGLEHSTTLNNVRSVAVFFDRSMVADAGERARVLATPPVLREMMQYAIRWPIDRVASDAAADRFFDTLADLVVDEFHNEVPLRLPATDDPLCNAVMQYTRSHLAEVDLEGVAAAVGASTRTLRRRFTTVVGCSWQEYRSTCRVLAAVAMFSDEPHRTVADVAHAVGYGNVNAFTRAFTGLMDVTPSGYRHRTLEPA
jgi:AraC-like DNA-binding protein